MFACKRVFSSVAPGKVFFYEGLISIPDPMGPIILAGQFIDKVEERETGLMIDCLALDMGLRYLVRVLDLKLSINMSVRSIGYRKWFEILALGLRTDSTIAERLILEIKERFAMFLLETVMKYMCDLQQKGINVALDDFGSASFHHLKDFRFDILKIDGEFSRGIEGNSDSQLLTQNLL